MTTTRKALAAFAALLPLAAVIGTAIYMAVRMIQHAHVRYGPRPPGPVELLLTDSPFSVNEWIGLGVVVLSIAFLEIFVAILFIVDLVRNVQISSGGRIAWILTMLFVGTFALPLYWLIHMALEKGRIDGGDARAGAMDPAAPPVGAAPHGAAPA